ncbi:hypothetical protein [Gordonia humi]|uniref:Uncharacterized protein n=1 Tax=Gordonia humi TaxID=686429 RepID=A0A840EY39_9ACTN|nr:hypothetical protein [Gordonia humi]MBB4135203.1 hypothetical protein [Gordonia humi]
MAAEIKAFAREYAQAAAKRPQTLEGRRSRRDWGPRVDWARPETGHTSKPSWLGNDPAAVFTSIDVGVRSH